MAFKKYKALSPDPFINKVKGDTEFARLAHLNHLIDQITANAVFSVTPTAVVFGSAGGGLGEDVTAFNFDNSTNTLNVVGGRIRIGDPGHWSGTDVRLNVYDYTTIATGTQRDDTYLAMWEKIWTLSNNTDLYFLKGNSVFVGYVQPDAVATLPVTDYQHNNFGVIFGGGFLQKTGVASTTVTGGNSWDNSIPVNYHKFLIQGSGDAKTINGFYASTKYTLELTNNTGTLQNYADVVLGQIKRSGVGSGYVVTNKYGAYILPVKADANVTNGYGIYQEGTSDLNYFGGKLGVKVVPTTYDVEILGSTNIGPVHWIGTAARLVTFINDTLAASATASTGRNAFFDKTITLGNNTAFTSFAPAVVTTSYMSADAVTSFSNDYQNASIISTYTTGGFLNKSGVATQTITTGSTAATALTLTATKFLLQSNDTKNITGFLANYRSALQLSSTGTVQHYADMVLGYTVRTNANGNNLVITNKYGVYIVAVKDTANVTNGWSIYSEGASDVAYFAGKLGVGVAAPVTTAKVQIDSTTQGFLLPRMTGAQVEAIASPAEGLMVYATAAGVGAVTAKGWWGYNGSTWVQLG